jgi:hypothetical protein
MNGRREPRYKRWIINPECVLQYLRKFDKWPKVIAVPTVDEGLSGPPEGAELMAVHYDHGRQCFVVVVYHPDFPEVSEGDEIPFALNPLNTQMRILIRRKDGLYDQAPTHQTAHCAE